MEPAASVFRESEVLIQVKVLGVQGHRVSGMSGVFVTVSPVLTSWSSVDFLLSRSTLHSHGLWCRPIPGVIPPVPGPPLTLPVSDPVSVRKPRYVRRERTLDRDTGPTAISSVEARVSNV